MKCPKCNAKNDFGNFCSNCGKPLEEAKKKANRLARKAKLEKAVSEKNAYVGRRELLILLLTFFLFLLPNLSETVSQYLVTDNWKFHIFYKDSPEAKILCFYYFSLCANFVFAGHLIEKKCGERFMKKFPEYAEIIRKRRMR